MKTAFARFLLGLAAIFFIADDAGAIGDPSIGEFAPRDPRPGLSLMPSRNEPNLYGFVRNDPINTIDPLGLWATEVHHQIVEDWLFNEKYKQYPWRCCKIPVRKLLMDGSDIIDGAGGHEFNFPSAQSSANAYQHAMKSRWQTVSQAEALYNQFLNDHIQMALHNAARAQRGSMGSEWGCFLMYEAVRELGKSFHAYSDSLSPSHKGFQTWYGPDDGESVFGARGYWNYVQAHKQGETMDIYKQSRLPILESVRGKFQGALDALLKE